jgi:hypothetical protein
MSLGGALFWYPEVKSIYMSECEFRGNTAPGFGKAIDIWGGWMAGCAPPSLKWLPDGYSNEAANTAFGTQPYNFTGCLAQCHDGMVRQSDGCHCC